MRFKEYPHAQTEVPEEGLMMRGDPNRTIANWGRFGCGGVRRFAATAFDLAEIFDLVPVPTRIFGIGMHKTGTTSLHHALKILGYSSAHWTNAHWAKAVYDEMDQFDRSSTLERTYAATDLPIGLLWYRLYCAYPGSKFILTMRGDDDWLRSVESHWNPETNKFRHQWDTDPFTHRLHRLVYGRKTFDPLVFLSRYIQHYSDVREYFSHNHPESLLVMREHRWDELCSFLNLPIPDQPYPRLNASGGD
jgi:hypothetical protein